MNNNKVLQMKKKKKKIIIIKLNFILKFLYIKYKILKSLLFLFCWMLIPHIKW